MRLVHAIVAFLVPYVITLPAYGQPLSDAYVKGRTLGEIAAEEHAPPPWWLISGGIGALNGATLTPPDNRSSIYESAAMGGAITGIGVALGVWISGESEEHMPKGDHSADFERGFDEGYWSERANQTVLQSTLSTLVGAGAYLGTMFIRRDSDRGVPIVFNVTP